MFYRFRNTRVHFSYFDASRCPHFKQGCSGCLLQNLQLDDQLEQKRQLLVGMLWDAYGLSEQEKRVRMEFLDDLRRLQVMEEYRPLNIHEVNGRFEYDNDEYKDRSFLEIRNMNYNEIEQLVDGIISERRPFR